MKGESKMKKGFALILAGLLVTVAMPVIAEEKPATQLEQFTTKKASGLSLRILAP